MLASKRRERHHPSCLMLSGRIQQNVYMGNKFLALRKSEVAKVAPDRAALMGKVSQEMADMKTIREADRRWLCLLFGEPYEAKFQSEGTGSAVHVYDGNGDEVLTYTAGVGWHEKESKAETQDRRNAWSVSSAGRHRGFRTDTFMIILSPMITVRILSWRRHTPM